MKIDQNRVNLDPPGTVRPDPARDERAAAAERAAQEGTDQVRVSSTGQLAAAAAAAATAAPDVRPDAVARARELLESGKLGSDATRLAESLIDSALDES